MSRTDANQFRESLKLWDRPMNELHGNHILDSDDNVSLLVEELFDRLMDLDENHPLVGNC